MIALAGKVAENERGTMSRGWVVEAAGCKKLSLIFFG
jgi:hypothetical protein